MYEHSVPCTCACGPPASALQQSDSYKYVPLSLQQDNKLMVLQECNDNLQQVQSTFYVTARTKIKTTRLKLYLSMISFQRCQRFIIKQKRHRHLALYLVSLVTQIMGVPEEAPSLLVISYMPVLSLLCIEPTQILRRDLAPMRKRFLKSFVM